MGNEWHYTQNRQPAAAPVTTAQLKQLAEQGLLKPDDLVWQEGMSEWKPAGVIKGLFPAKPSVSEARGVTSPRAVTTEPPVSLGSPLSSHHLGRQTDPAHKMTRDEDELGGDTDEGGLHPLLVWFLTVITLGLFGLWYVWSTHRQQAEGARGIDAAGKPLGAIRHPALVLILGFLTLGFYTRYWVSKALQECANYLGRRDINSRTELCLMLCLPFYSVYLAVYRLPQLVQEVQAQVGQPQVPSLIPAILANPLLFLSLPIVCMIQQGQLNACWRQAK
jgi:hypothetical protein